MLPKALLYFSVKAYVVDSIYGHTASRDLRIMTRAELKEIITKAQVNGRRKGQKTGRSRRLKAQP